MSILNSLLKVMKKIILSILLVISVLIPLAIVGLFWFGYSFNKSLEPKIDPSLYSEVVKTRLNWSDRYAFLPKRIPQDTNNVAFFHIQGFLQGGDVIALRVSLPFERIESALNSLEASGRTEITSFEGIPSPRAYPEYGMEETGWEDMYKRVATIPEDFRIFLFKSDLENIKKRWNHNILSFTAISIKRNEIIYYIDNW